MSAASLPDLALRAGSAVGRYFSVVTVLPSALLVMFIYTLNASGAWAGAPRWSTAGTAFSDLGIGRVLLLLVVSLALSVVTHPLQFALVQLFEGYWGSTALAIAVRTQKTAAHRRRHTQLSRAMDGPMDRLPADEKDLEGEDGGLYLPDIIAIEELERELQSYPRESTRLMPSRLGNMLRRHEDMAGAQYGLEALTIAPHIALVAPPHQVQYLDDSREQLDLAVRVCALAFAAALISFAFLVDDGLWLLVAVFPYLIAYLSYRGAVVAAQAWGTALGVLIDLNRFRLYEELHVALPGKTADERHQNAMLMNLLRVEPDAAGLSYRHPAVEGLQKMTTPPEVDWPPWRSRRGAADRATRTGRPINQCWPSTN